MDANKKKKEILWMNGMAGSVRRIGLDARLRGYDDGMGIADGCE